MSTPSAATPHDLETERNDKRAELHRAALENHEFPKPGKIAISATKQLTNQRDLALAYSPGVAAPCEPRCR
jgi:malate dehydrogenase (oxaloacetate-decarboxylating)(NADP+)